MPSFSRKMSTPKYTSIIITNPSKTTKAALSNVWLFQTQKLCFETKIGKITNPRIQPLFSIKVERPIKLTLNKIKYEFSKQFCLPSKSDFKIDEKLATEPASDFVAPQLTNETKCQKKLCNKYIFEIFK